MSSDRFANPAISFVMIGRFRKSARAITCALLSAGAYGFVMASNYNTRPMAAEVLVNGKQAALVRERQPVEEIWAGEKLAPWLK